ncbi:NUDIX domain-containing protein [Paenibacillus aceris]|uniref:8-oxo-dGTP pyrophosphatase MutT (NUDIX family) n=1 Tax=Paenibacillus aceris TaxID=869555 RepID=A0ABS4HRE3_9BACL|nr:NUDIX domain-containing protein [Paenibacillus aceris]MBP1960986.1 8-oxo-dGTP pyrophosphatase MutT (NUDIX family) [Paenibacillus aceris]NHW35349.1 NUDIX domain-containing protein [Paenibacillus aceris]
MPSNKEHKYHVLARGIILSGDCILVAHCIGMDNTFLPGGHIEFREGIRTSLAREIKEELGLESEVKVYLGAVEAEFDQEEVYHQEMNHLFIADIPAINHLQNPESKEKHLEFFWIPLNEMETHNLQPYPVRTVIANYLNQVPGPYLESTFH